MLRRFDQVDVFTATPLHGNPLAVVHDADALDEATMRAVASWTNLSETAFLHRPTTPAAHYRVRIFTPMTELPFAGHPTLGSCHAYRLASGNTDEVVVQECGVGLVRIHAREGGLAFEAPPLRKAEFDEALLDGVLRALAIPRSAVVASASLDNGPVWNVLLLDSPERVLAIDPDHAALARLAKVGVVSAYPEGAECRFEVRAFAAAAGIPEDPVTGSLQAALADWLIDSGLGPTSYVASQGARVGRRGRVAIERRDGTTRVGGSVAPCITGTIDLDAFARPLP